MQNLKRLIKYSFFPLLLALTSMLIFQNCGQGMTPVGGTTAAGSTATGNAAVSLTPCIASGCPQAFNYIQLEVANNNPISYLASGSTIQESAIDVAGYCNTGGYPTSHIYYSIQDLNGNIVVPTSPTTGNCDPLGKFHFAVGIANLNGSSNYELNVILRAVDSTGVEYENSLGLNKKQVGLSPRTGI